MRWLVDNSVIQRLPRSADVRDAIATLQAEGATLCSSPVTVLEAGFSARSPEEHGAVVEAMTAGFQLIPFSVGVGPLAIELQSRLWAAGLGRAVGARDLLIGAAAAAAGAGVLHYDADFETLARVDDRIRHRWVVPRGAVD